MKRLIVFLLMAVLLIPFVTNAQDEPVLPDSFVFDYSLRLWVKDLETFSARVSLQGSGTVDRPASALELTANGTIQLGTARFTSLDAALRWVDDVLYVNPGDGWQAYNGAADYVAGLLEQYAGLGADTSALARWDFFGVDGVTGILAALAPARIGGVHGASGVDGDRVTLIVDVVLHELMQYDGFVDAVAAFAAVQGNNLILATPDELAQIVRDNSAAFENSNLVYTRYFEGSDTQLDRFTFDLNLPIDPTALGYPDAPFTVTATLDVTLRDEAPQPITAPDDARQVSAFSFPPLEAEMPGAGSFRDVYIETIGEGETFSQSFNAMAGDVVTITVRGLGLSFDPFVTLLSPEGDVLAENDDHEAPAFGVGDYDSQIVDFAIPADGAYRVEISELSGYAGSFVLTVNVKRG